MTGQRQTDALIARYLRDVRSALRSLPTATRDELVREIAERIATARQDMDPENITALQNLLEGMGSPEDLAREAGLGGRDHSRQDAWALWLILLGGFLAGIGWLVGVVLLWRSTTWTRAAKVAGTLLIPGGLATVFVLASLGTKVIACGNSSSAPGHPPVMQCTATGFALSPAIGLPLFIVLLIVPMVTVFLLARRRRAYPTL